MMGKVKQPANSYKQFIAQQSQQSSRTSRQQRIQSAHTHRAGSNPKPQQTLRKQNSKKRAGSKKSSLNQMGQPPHKLNTISHLDR